MVSERIQRRIDRLLDQVEEAADQEDWLSVLRLTRQVLELDSENRDAQTFLEVAQDVSANLGALVRVHEEWLGETTEQQRDLILVAKNIDRTLKDLADTAAAAR